MSITTAQGLPEATTTFGAFSASSPLAQTETVYEGRGNLVVQATDDLTAIGKSMWSHTLQDTLDFGDTLEGSAIVGVKRLDVVTHDMGDILGDDFDPEAEDSEKEPVILSLAVDGQLQLRTLYRAAWAGYILSLEATIAAGTNDRCWLNDGNADTAREVVVELGATATPHSCVYGSGGTFMEGCDLSFDADTGVLRANVMIGS